MKYILSLVILFVFIMDSKACRCGYALFDQEIILSDFIFQGQVLSNFDEKYRIKVLKIWKGNITQEIFEFEQAKTNCSLRKFRIGTEYIFYIRDSVVHNCSRTTEIDSTADLELLNCNFNHEGNYYEIVGESLTEFQKKLLERIIKNRPEFKFIDIEKSNFLYAFETKQISKQLFFDNLNNSLYNLHVIKTNKVNEYILWIGDNFEKSKKKLWIF